MKLHTLQILRALAAILVLLLHQSSAEGIFIAERGGQEAPLLGSLFTNGYAGVDLFFLISGFVMVHVAWQKPPTRPAVTEFLFARIFRIYPVYWLLTCIVMIYFVVATNHPWEIGRTLGSDQSGTGHILSSLLLLPQPAHPVIGQAWTLVHEMYFYLAFALLLLLPQKRRLLALAGWAVVVALGALAGLSGPHANNLSMLVFHPMTLQFIAGAGVGLLYLHKIIWRPGVLLSVGGLLTVLALVVHPEPSPFTQEWGRVLIFTLPFALMLCGAAGVNDRVEVQAKWVRYPSRLGDWSYALYLIHTLVVVATEKLMWAFANLLEHFMNLPPEFASVFRVGSEGSIDNFLFCIACITGSIFVSGLIHHFFELPLLRTSKQLRLRILGKKRAAAPNGTAAQ